MRGFSCVVLFFVIVRRSSDLFRIGRVVTGGGMPYLIFGGEGKVLGAFCG